MRIPDMTQRFPEGMNGIDLTPSYFGEPMDYYYENEIRYGFNVYYVDECLHKEDNFKTEDDAINSANSYIETKIAEWEADGVKYDKNLFDVETRWY